MEDQPLNIVILGLSITSSWGNGHATTYRGLARELHNAGHRVLFLERERAWYAENRDLSAPNYCELHLYNSLQELREKFSSQIEQADMVMVGSFVPDGIKVGEWVTDTAGGITAFYDIDTPVTLKKIERGNCDYISPKLIPKYNLYLSFTGGPALRYIEQKLNSPAARPLYCSFDPSEYHPVEQEMKWDLGYLGTYSEDRQPTLEELLIKPAQQWNKGRFVVSGPMYPQSIRWPSNVEQVEHLAPGFHRWFYTSQRFTLNVTRKEMIGLGYSPSVRLFEAAACATPIISDYWKGLDHFFELGKEILIAKNKAEVVRILKDFSEEKRKIIGENARRKVLQNHTAAHRAKELIGYLNEANYYRYEQFHSK